MYRKLYVDGCVDIVCNAVKVQSPLTLEQLCQIIQENLPGSCVPKDNLKEDARLVILDDSSFTIEYANTVPETKLLFSIAHELGHLILHFLEDDGNGKLKTKESVNIGEVEEYALKDSEPASETAIDTKEEPDVEKDSETGKTTEENFDIEDNEESSIEDELDVLEDELPLL